jgi:uncharacterized protein involved in outer membrane biogenesis
LNKWKRRAIIAGSILAVIVFIPFLIPMSAYIGQAEQSATDALGAPVSIDSLRIALLPSPRLNIDGLVIGKDKEISAERVAVVPAITSLFSDVKVLSSIQVKKPVIKRAALEILSAISKKPSAGPATVNINQVIVKEVKFEWPGMTLPEFNVEIALVANKPESALIESLDGKLKMQLTPQDKLQTITLSADKWTVPVGPPLLIDKLKADVVLYDNRLEISQLDAALYKGKVSGNATLNWGKDWRMAGKIRVDDLAVREPVSLMSKSTNVSGRLFGNGSFNANAKEPAKLADRLNADFRFKVTDGVLYGLDLARAATMLLSQGQKGGETKFDELSGLLNVAGKQYKFSDLKVTSGLMAASGDVKISPTKELDGVVEVEVKRSVSMAAIPLQISGTLDSPTVFPTKAAMAGAVAGTALLGPGVGTGLGVKAGSAMSKLKGLFGGSDK